MGKGREKKFRKRGQKILKGGASLKAPGLATRGAVAKRSAALASHLQRATRVVARAEQVEAAERDRRVQRVCAVRATQRLSAAAQLTARETVRPRQAAQRRDILERHPQRQRVLQRLRVRLRAGGAGRGRDGCAVCAAIGRAPIALTLRTPRRHRLGGAAGPPPAAPEGIVVRALVGGCAAVPSAAVRSVGAGRRCLGPGIRHLRLQRSACLQPAAANQNAADAAVAAAAHPTLAAIAGVTEAVADEPQRVGRDGRAPADRQQQLLKPNCQFHGRRCCHPRQLVGRLGARRTQANRRRARRRLLRRRLRRP